MIEHDRLLEEEGLILDASELICQLLEGTGTSRSTLAARMGRTKGHVSQLLNGNRNMTLRTLADAAYALGYRLRLTGEPLEDHAIDLFSLPTTSPQATLQFAEWFRVTATGNSVSGATAALLTFHSTIQEPIREQAPEPVVQRARTDTDRVMQAVA